MSTQRSRLAENVTNFTATTLTSSPFDMSVSDYDLISLPLLHEDPRLEGVAVLAQSLPYLGYEDADPELYVVGVYPVPNAALAALDIPAHPTVCLADGDVPASLSGVLVSLMEGEGPVFRREDVKLAMGAFAEKAMNTYLPAYVESLDA